MRLAARWLGRLGLGLLGLLALLALGPYALTPTYTFPPPTPFAGRTWFNPYVPSPGSWRETSLHAHGMSCCTEAIARRADARVEEYYRRLGYDVALVSDHQRLSTLPGLPEYEHGINVRKTHQLVLGARHVDWFDYVLFQSVDDKQYVLDRLRAQAPVIVLAHPEIRHGYTFDDLRRLTGYNLMEVMHEDASYEPWWDVALSAGRLSWATGSDDAHGIGRPYKMGLSWTMIRAPSTHSADLLAALEAGRTYAVTGEHGANDVRLRAVEVRADTLVVRTDPGALTFTFIGQGGRTRAVVRADSEARYLLRPEDSYIRTVVRTPHTALYLNPVVRSNGGLPAQAAAVPGQRAWLFPTGFLGLLLAAAAGLRRRAHTARPARPARPAVRV